MAFNYENTSDVESSSNKSVPNEEDEELAALRLAALLSRKSVSQKKQEVKVPSFQDNDLPHSSFIKTQTGPPRNFRGGRRRGTTVQKSSHRSNLIIINPVALEDNGNEQECGTKTFPKVVLPQHKWCVSGTEDSMSPKSSTFKKKDAGRFSRFECDSESESDFDIQSSTSSDGNCAVKNYFCDVISGEQNVDEITSEKVPLESDLESQTISNCAAGNKILSDSEELEVCKTENSYFEVVENKSGFENAELPGIGDHVNTFCKNSLPTKLSSENSLASSKNKLKGKLTDVRKSDIQEEKCFDEDFNIDQNTKTLNNDINFTKKRKVSGHLESRCKFQNTGSSVEDVDVNKVEQRTNLSPVPSNIVVSCDLSSTDLNDDCQKQNRSLCRNDLRIQLKERKLCRNQLGKNRKCRHSSSCSDSSTSSSFCQGADSQKLKSSTTCSSGSSSGDSSPSSSDESYTPTVKSILSVVKPVSLESPESSNANAYKKQSREKRFNTSPKDKRSGIELRLMKHNHMQSEDNHKSHPYVSKELLGSSLISEKSIRNCMEKKSEASVINNKSDYDSAKNQSSRRRLPVHMRLGIPAKKRYVEMKGTRKSVKSNQGWRKETAVELQPSNLRIVAEVRENYSGYSQPLPSPKEQI